MHDEAFTTSFQTIATVAIVGKLRAILLSALPRIASSGEQ
jgi:hypothetical protein